MAIYIYWFLLALLLLGVEMATGTFYLLVIAVAMSAGGVVALLGLGFPAQLVIAALAGAVGIVILRRMKDKDSSGSDAGNQSLDVGQPVKVLSWREDGTARVFYRGAEWDAELDAEDARRDGTLYIKTIRGSVLIVSHHKAV
jgi:membrane protein implicated in regulation of membrane protease activity